MGPVGGPWLFSLPRRDHRRHRERLVPILGDAQLARPVRRGQGHDDLGASYTHDFIEVQSRHGVRAARRVLLAVASATGNFGSTTAQLTDLSGSLAPGQYVLVQEAQGAGGTTPLPAPFITDPNPIAMSATAAKVALVNTTVPLNCGRRHAVQSRVA